MKTAHEIYVLSLQTNQHLCGTSVTAGDTDNVESACDILRSLLLWRHAVVTA